MILGDEPTGNLDERTRDDIIGLLENLWRERGQTVIIVTHDTWVASRASRRIWLDEGRLTDAGYGSADGVDAGASRDERAAARRRANWMTTFGRRHFAGRPGGEGSGGGEPSDDGRPDLPGEMLATQEARSEMAAVPTERRRGA